MYGLSILSVLPSVVLAANPVRPVETYGYTCGSVEYDGNHYTCFNTTTGGQVICPYRNWVKYYPCGDECYYSPQYSCNDEDQTLSLRPVETLPFVLWAASDAGRMDLESFHARDGRFYIDGQSKTSCPPPADAHACSLYYDHQGPVFSSGGSLAVDVPGGQQVYIKKDGTMSYTVAHDTSKPDMLYEIAGTPYTPDRRAPALTETGGFVGPNETSWAACPDTAGSWFIVAVPREADRVPADCVSISLTVFPLYEGVLGAWQYD